MNPSSAPSPARARRRTMRSAMRSKMRSKMRGTMRWVVPGLLATAMLGSSPLWGAPQRDDEVSEKDQLAAKYEAKLQLPFVEAIDWQLELANAKKKSQELSLPIVAYFTRSYAP